MAAEVARIRVSVVFALPDQQYQVEFECDMGTTIEDAVALSGLGGELDKYTNLEYGVYGFRQPADFVLTDGDRVEIYRALEMSPTEARRLRAANRSN